MEISLESDKDCNEGISKAISQLAQMRDKRHGLISTHRGQAPFSRVLSTSAGLFTALSTVAISSVGSSASVRDDRCVLIPVRRRYCQPHSREVMHRFFHYSQ